MVQLPFDRIRYRLILMVLICFPGLVFTAHYSPVWGQSQSYSDGTIGIPLSATLLENIDGFPSILLPTGPTKGTQVVSEKDRVDLVIKIEQSGYVYAALGMQDYVPLGGLDAQPMKTKSTLLLELDIESGHSVSYADDPSKTRVLTADSSVTRQAIDILLKPRNQGGFGAIFLYGRFLIPISGGDRLKQDSSLRERHAVTSKIVQLIHQARSWQARRIQLQTQTGLLNKFAYTLGTSQSTDEDKIPVDQTTIIGDLTKQDKDPAQAGTVDQRPEPGSLADAIKALTAIEESGGLNSKQSKNRGEDRSSGADLGVFYNDDAGQLRGFYMEKSQAKEVYAALYSAGYPKAVLQFTSPSEKQEHNLFRKLFK